MNYISFTVPGNPQALKRHRTFNMKGRSIQYDPSKGDKADFLAKCMEHKPETPWTGPVWVTLRFTFSRPKSHLRANGQVKPSAPMMHATKPDVDNLTKLVMDALNGVFFRDDSQVYYTDARKGYGDTPGVDVTLREFGEN